MKFEEMLHKTHSPTMKRRYEKRKGYRMATSREIIVQGYCFRCQRKQQIENGRRVVLKSDRHAVRGVCSSCGTKMYVIVKANTVGR